MESLWPLPVIVTVGVVLLVMLRIGPRLFPGTRLTDRAFWCPFKARDVAVQFEETVWDGELCDVEQCTAFSPSTAVACDKKCLRLRDLPARRREAVQSVA
jgi:hypothetical protein